MIEDIFRGTETDNEQALQARLVLRACLVPPVRKGWWALQARLAHKACLVLPACLAHRGLRE
jgi:hypothetical protein